MSSFVLNCQNSSVSFLLHMTNVKQVSWLDLTLTHPKKSQAQMKQVLQSSGGVQGYFLPFKLHFGLGSEQVGLKIATCWSLWPMLNQKKKNPMFSCIFFIPLKVQVIVTNLERSRHRLKKQTNGILLYRFLLFNCLGFFSEEKKKKTP